MKHLLRVSAIIVLLAFFSSCGEDRDLMSCIPSSSTVVMRVSPPLLLEKCGGSIGEDGKLQLGPELGSLSSQGIFPFDFDLFGEIAPFISLDEIFAFTPADDSGWWIVARLRDKKSLENFLVSLGAEKRKEKSVQVFNSDRIGVCYIDGDIVWWVPRPYSTPSISALLESVKSDGSIGTVPGVGDFLRHDAMLRIACGNPLEKNQWLCADISVGSTDLKAEISVVSATGTFIRFDSLRAIDPRFIRFIPGNPVFVGAAGFPKGFDWSPVGKMFAKFGDFEAYGAFEAILPFLKTVDGTVGIACAPRDSSFFEGPDMYNTVFSLAAEMPHDDAVKAVKAIERNFRNMIPVTSYGSDRLAAVFDGIVFRVGYYDGFLVVTNIDADKAAQAPLNLAPSFTQKPLEIIFDVPRSSWQAVFGYDIPSRAEVDIHADSEKIFVRIGFPEVQGLLLPALIKSNVIEL